jgi:hypothetical protein
MRAALVADVLVVSAAAFGRERDRMTKQYRAVAIDNRAGKFKLRMRQFLTYKLDSSLGGDVIR